MSNRLTNLTNYRDRLENAYFNGVKTVKTPDGIETTFQSGTEMRAALQQLEGQIARLKGQTKRPVAASINLGGF